MPKFIEASLVLTFSIAVTALIMVVVFPVHALGGASPSADSAGIRAAVHVEGVRSCPATGETTGECPFLAQRLSSVSCPYLAALAAASRCPAQSERGKPSECPFLSGQEPPDPHLKIARTESDPTVHSL